MMVCLSVCLSVCNDRQPAKTAEPIELPFGMCIVNSGKPNEPLLDGVQSRSPYVKGQF